MRRAEAWTRRSGVSDADIDLWMAQRWRNVEDLNGDGVVWDNSLADPEPAQEVSSFEAEEAADLSVPQVMDLGLRFRVARPGSSISALIGSSDPAAIGKFLSLNGMDGRNSTLREGRSYVVPTSWDDATSAELKRGQHLLGADNRRLQEQAEERALEGAARAREMEWVLQGRNIFTGELAADRSAVRAPKAPPRRSKLDDNKLVRTAVGVMGWGNGLAPGVFRGAYHAARDGVEGASFVARLANPLDALISDPGQSAVQQLAAAGVRSADYLARGFGDPSIMRDDINRALHDFRTEQDPFATPQADTLRDEFQRTRRVGMNNGEFLFDVGSTVVGGEAIKGAVGLGRAAKAASATEQAYLAANPGFARRLAEQYAGMSHHIIGRNAKLPEWLGGGKYPKWLIESEFNKIAHEGMSTRDVFRNHVGVDRNYGGGKVRTDMGPHKWSAEKNLDWELYDPIDRLRYGTSPYTKAVVGPVLFGGGTAGFQHGDSR